MNGETSPPHTQALTPPSHAVSSYSGELLQALPLLTFQQPQKLTSAVALRAGRCCFKSPGSPPSQFQH